MARRTERDSGASPDEARSANGGQGQRRAERLHDSADRRARQLHDAANHRARELHDATNHRPLDSVWLRPEHAPRGQRRALDRDMIVRAAIEVADEEGPEAISMRRIATRLGVGTMSLYWHVASKEELLDLVFDAVLGEEVLPEHPSGDWRADLVLLARQMRALMHRHPWLVSLLHVASRLGPNSLAHAEFSMATVADLGLDAVTSFSIPNAVDDYVRGAVLGELEWAEFKRRTEEGEGGWSAVFDSYREQAEASGRYPALLRFFSDTAHLGAYAQFEFSAETHFEFGLSCLLDGIAGQVAARRK